MSQPGEYFYRCYSNSSAGALISGAGLGHGKPLGTNLFDQFISHVLNPSRQHPTALISTSSRLIDTLQRAFSKFYNHREHPNQIWIAFIYVPDEDKRVYHHAEDLAEQCEHEEPQLFRYEYLFEWEIPAKYLVHTVSVETLMNRGFDMDLYLHNNVFPNTHDLRWRFASIMLKPWYEGYDIGLGLGLMVRAFGARAPVRQLALQLVRDCHTVRQIDNKSRNVFISYGDGDFRLDAEQFHAIEEGIDTALMDWWLADTDFYKAYEEYCDWAVEIENEDVIENDAIAMGL
jgi:hypothetical protein